MIMSIKTKHANKIFEGTKTFEYRKKSIENKNLNKICFIYSSEVDKSIIGYVIFDYIVSGDFNYIINNTKPEDIDTLKNYFNDSSLCYALHIKEYKKFDKPISLLDIKKYDKNFVVPQYYRYLKKDEYVYNLLIKRLNK